MRVIRMKARFNHTVGRVWLERVDPNSMPTFIASCPRSFEREHYTPNSFVCITPVMRVASETRYDFLCGSSQNPPANPASSAISKGTLCLNLLPSKSS